MVLGLSLFSGLTLVSGCGGGGGEGGASASSDGGTPETPSNSVTLTWVAPSTSYDGSPLTDLEGYKVYYGTATNTYSTIIDVGNVTTYTITGLSSGTYYFTITAYDSSMDESQFSTEVNKTI